MHELIDDFAWIVIALVPITILFVIGAAFIFLDEGLRTLVRRFRNHIKALHASSETITSPTSFMISPESLQEPKVRPSGSKCAFISMVWQTLCLKAHAAKSKAHLRLYAGHPKP